MKETVYKIITRGCESWGDSYDKVLAETRFKGVAEGLLDYFEDSHHNSGELYIESYVVTL